MSENKNPRTVQFQGETYININQLSEFISEYTGSQTILVGLEKKPKYQIVNMTPELNFPVSHTFKKGSKILSVDVNESASTPNWTGYTVTIDDIDDSINPTLAIINELLKYRDITLNFSSFNDDTIIVDIKFLT